MGSRRFACRRCDAVFAVDPTRAVRPPVVLLPPTFRRRSWEAAYRRRSARAAASVPLYRERATPWLQPVKPLSVTDLDGNESRICPISRPWDPRAGASLWIESPRNLLGAVRTARPKLPRDAVVLEVRDALLDRRVLGPHRYAVLLSSRAVVRSEQWRMEYNARIVARATEASEHLVVVGSGGDAPKDLIERAALLGPPAAGAAIVHDPRLGYLAARAHRCGVLHVNWRDYHVRVLENRLAWTDLRRSRPTLVDVLAGPGRYLGECPRHQVPALFIAEDR